MAVTADNCHPWQGFPQLRAGYMNNSVVGVPDTEVFNAEGFAVLLQGLNLRPGHSIPYREMLIFSGNIVISSGGGLVRPENTDAPLPQAVECLRAGHLVDIVPVNVKYIGTALYGLHRMCIPDLVKQRSRFHCLSLILHR